MAEGEEETAILDAPRMSDENPTIRKEPTEQERRLQQKVDQAFYDGTLLTLSISGTGFWRKPIRKGELTKQGVELPDNYRGGYKAILEKEAVQPLEQTENAARRVLQMRALPFPILGASFIQDRHFDQVLARLSELEEQFWSQVQNLIDNYDDYIAQFRDRHPTQWDFVKDDYPDKDKLRNLFGWKMTPWKMRFPDMGEVNVEDRIRQGRIEAQYRDQLERALAREQEKAHDQMQSFVEQSLRHIRGYAVETFREILARKQEGNSDPRFNERTIKRIRSVIDYVREMDFMEDNTLEESLQSVEQTLGSHVDFKDDKAAIGELKDVLGKASKDIEEGMNRTSQAITTAHRRLTL